MKSVAPNLYVNNINTTVEFYKQLGFTVVATVPDEAPFVFVMMTCGTVTFMFQTVESLGNVLPSISRNSGGSILLYIQTSNIRDFFEQIKDKVKVLKGIEKTFYGATEFCIEDNNGFVITFAEDE
jgi:uncharacterized glyoxalase superfamily protein PhnB